MLPTANQATQSETEEYIPLAEGCEEYVLAPLHDETKAVKDELQRRSSTEIEKVFHKQYSNPDNSEEALIHYFYEVVDNIHIADFLARYLHASGLLYIINVHVENLRNAFDKGKITDEKYSKLLGLIQHEKFNIKKISTNKYVFEIYVCDENENTIFSNSVEIEYDAESNIVIVKNSNHQCFDENKYPWFAEDVKIKLSNKLKSFISSEQHDNVDVIRVINL